jgi:hypothetical protein
MQKLNLLKLLQCRLTAMIYISVVCLGCNTKNTNEDLCYAWQIAVIPLDVLVPQFQKRCLKLYSVDLCQAFTRVLRGTFFSGKCCLEFPPSQPYGLEAYPSPLSKMCNPNFETHFLFTIYFLWIFHSLPQLCLERIQVMFGLISSG